MAKLTITLTLDDDEADALLDLLRRAETHYAPTLAAQQTRLVAYAERRIDAARIARGRKRGQK